MRMPQRRYLDTAKAQETNKFHGTATTAEDSIRYSKNSFAMNSVIREEHDSGTFDTRMKQIDQYLSDRIQMFVYVFIVYGSWWIIFKECYPLISQSDNVPDYHKSVGYIVFFMCVTSWRLACTIQPGNITKDTIQRFDNYPYDNLIYKERICPTLQIRKLPRSKFNRKTGLHVPRFDHHCGWLQQSIGEENYRYFVLFLIVHTGMCWYGSFVTSNLLWGEIYGTGLMTISFTRRLIAFAYVLSSHICLTGALLVMSIMSIVLCGFLGFHLYIMSIGMTTNEFMKWRVLKECYANESANCCSDQIVSCTLSGGEDEVSTKKKVPSKIGLFPKNIYDQGILSNFSEVIFPRSLRNYRNSNSPEVLDLELESFKTK